MLPTLLAEAVAKAEVPVVWVLPFALFLLAIATLPLFLGKFWEHNKNKGVVVAIASIPVAAWLLFGIHGGAHWLVESLEEYVAFLVLLGSLFVISGGIYLKGSLAGTPVVNTAFLAVGALIASIVGTTGASMLLIRPLLRANAPRQKKVHIVIFFIFVVSNAGGMLTPLGDPPLFIGFLRGVPFTWTFQLFTEWALVNGILLVLFNFWDQRVFNKEEIARPGSQLEDVQKVKVPLSIEGKQNLLFLLGVVAVIYVVGTYGSKLSDSATVQKAAQVVGMLAMTALSLKTTSKAIREANRFSYGPIIEVAVIFLGIFVTMVPATHLLEAWGESGRISVDKSWQFFWASGALSSFLDNAPTYATFSALASGVVGRLHGTVLDPQNLGLLLNYPEGVAFLKAVACGSVMMGANTYIGNGPNFMVKAIAEENQVKMPSFFGYMAWSVGILVPIFLLVTFLFFS